MTKACVKTSGTSTTKGASVLFFGFHWSFTILEPSGKGWPLSATPALYASIMVGLATITLSTSSVRAEETTAQSSYPLKSENAIPLGDFSEYLSCAETAVPLRAASTAAVATIVSLVLRFMADPFLVDMLLHWSVTVEPPSTRLSCRGRARQTTSRSVPEFDRLDGVFKRPFQNAPADGPEHEPEHPTLD